MTRPTLPAELPRTLPDGHRRVLVSLVERLSADPRVVGVAVAGSFVFDVMDEFSDLDLVVAVEPAHLEGILGERKRIAGSLGNLLAAFTGEHVGEPRLLICLYGDPLLHVDLKFVALPDAAARIEEPVILWERDGRLAAVLAARPPVPPRADRQWIEDRFWIWVHYTAAKIARGELFETIDSLAYLRRQVLGPLGLERRGLRPTGVRRIEAAAPELARQLRATLAGHDAADCLRALHACTDLYRSLRADHPGVVPGTAAERAALEYLTGVQARVTG